MTSALIWLIEFYQKYFSPDHSFWAKRRFPYGYCRFIPSCSEYFRMSLHKSGLWRGLFRGILRILRCNPFTTGGYNPVTIKEK